MQGERAMILFFQRPRAGHDRHAATVLCTNNNNNNNSVFNWYGLVHIKYYYHDIERFTDKL